MSKTKIALLTVAVLALPIAGLIGFAFYNFSRKPLLSFSSEQLADVEIALKGELGEAIFSGQPLKAVPDAAIEGKSGMDALLAPLPAGPKGTGLIEAYRRDPKKFKRYAEMLDTAINAKRVGAVVLGQQFLEPPQTSESLVMEDPKFKVDAWGSPFCLIRIAERMAVVSGGPSHLPCDALPLNSHQIANSKKSMYAGPSDVIVVIVAHPPVDQPLSQGKRTTGS